MSIVKMFRSISRLFVAKRERERRGGERKKERREEYILHR
jgi:hypothetical protein